MDTDGVIQLITIVILLFLSAFFSSAETALTTVNRMRIRFLAEEGDKRAIKLQKILGNYSQMLSTILVGNNIVNITTSSIATALAIRVWGNYAVGITAGVLTVLVLLFGEITPKHWAALTSEKLALAYSHIIYLLIKIFTPVIFVIDKLSGFLFWLLHIDSTAKSAAITESELKSIVDVSHEGGMIEAEEREMIYNVFDFTDSLAKDIMIPRIDMTSISLNATYEELFSLFRESMYTRIPVYEDDVDNVIGIVNVKDLLLVEHPETFQIKRIIRDAYYTYEYKKTADLMMKMREKSSNMALVLNEYGATVGLITLEDLLEEIVGEIRDEYDDDEDDFIKEISSREYLVDGNMKLDDINDAIGTELDSENYDSIGGIIIELLDRLPEDKEVVTTREGITLLVQGVNQNRVEKVLITLPEPEDEAADAASDEPAAADTTVD